MRRRPAGARSAGCVSEEDRSKGLGYRFSLCLSEGGDRYSVGSVRAVSARQPPFSRDTVLRKDKPKIRKGKSEGERNAKEDTRCALRIRASRENLALSLLYRIMPFLLCLLLSFSDTACNALYAPVRGLYRG